MAVVALQTWRLVAETKEFVGPITVTVDDVPVTGFDVQVVADGARPEDSDWESATVLEGDTGVLVGVGTSFPLVVGTKYLVYVRVTDTPEIPVLRAGILRAI